MTAAVGEAAQAGRAALRQRFERMLEDIEHPARLAGGEVNASAGYSFAADELRVALAFPDAYEVGISNQALQILYHLARTTPGVGVERAYLPWVDAIAALRDRQIPLLTVESWTPLSDVHLLGVTLQHELNYTNLLELLDLAGIPAWARERDQRHPLVVAGGPAIAGFRPMAPFLDAIVVGDGEAVFPDVLEVVGSAVRGGASRGDALAALSEIDGVFVPELSTRVRRRVSTTLAGAPYPRDCLVAVTEGVHDRAWVEVMRGCSRGCRYCQAGMWYRPVRERMPDEVVALAAAELAASGHDEVSLGSLSTTDYSGLGTVLRRMAAEHPDVEVSLPSLRVDSAAVRLGHLTSPTSTSITLAPEAGSQRLRDVINKNVSEEDILRAVEEAVRLGHTTLKLYFMMGLPTETDDDVAAIAELCRAIRDRGRRALGSRGNRLQLNVSVSTFIPKPFTPFQWAAMPDRVTLDRRQALLRGAMRRVGARLALHDVGSAYLEAALARGGEELARVIHGAWQRGARFDSWTEQRRPDVWAAAFEEAGLSAEQSATSARGRDEPLPWDVIEGVVDRDFLWAEWERALAGETSDDCRWSACLDCGACRPGLCIDTAEVALPAGPSSALPAGSSLAGPAGTPGGPATVVADSDRPGRRPAAADDRRWVLTFSARGPARLLGHLDTAEVIRRAVRRAGGRLAMTQGFRPKPRLSVALPRAVGVTGLAELAEFFLAVPPPDDFVERLAATLPAGFSLVGLTPAPPGRSLAARVEGARYRVLATPLEPGGPSLSALELAAAGKRYTESTEMLVERVRLGGRKRLDVRSFVPAVAAREADGVIELEFETAVSPLGTARPEDVVSAVSALLGRPLVMVAAVRSAIILRSET